MDVSDIFYFFCSGEGKGESEVPGVWGGFFYWKIPGGGSPGWVGGAGGGEGVCREGVCGEFGGGG